jgi:hypothetical protein
MVHGSSDRSCLRTLGQVTFMVTLSSSFSLALRVFKTRWGERACHDLFIHQWFGFTGPW